MDRDSIFKELLVLDINEESLPSLIRVHNMLVTFGEFSYERTGANPFTRKEISLIRRLGCELRNYLAKSTKTPEEKKKLFKEINRRKYIYWKEN